MHLRRLDIKGFKSFASTTTLELEPGITCVVGPNGSGKSNVVDALSWVMGEQGAKSLRGGKMEDVIFAGTSKRSGLGRAQVSLTIDNTDGALGIDYSEVTITRTMFRAGGSEYSINGSSARLADVADLLSDAGIGREMHVIVGQNQLDAVLRATPEERRGFIEEAAGILKHRKRKEKALRKLDAMAANVARLQDLTAEVSRGLGPLGRQAKIARKAETITFDVRDAALRLLADDIVTTRADLRRHEQARAHTAGQLEALQTDLQAATAEAEAQSAVAAAHAATAKAASDQWRHLATASEQLRGDHNLATERARLLDEPVPQPGGQSPEELRAQLERAEAEVTEHEGELERLKSRLDEASRDRTARDADVARLQSEHSAAVRAASQRREQLTTLQARADAAAMRVDSTHAERARLESGVADAQMRAQRAGSAQQAAVAELEGFSSHGEGLDAEYQAAQSQVEATEAALGTVRAAHREADNRVASLRARAEALELSLRGAREKGLADFSRADAPTVRGVLSEVVTVTPGFEDDVAAALGPLGDAMVVDDVDGAVSVLGFVRRTDSSQTAVLVAGTVAHEPAAAGPTAEEQRTLGLESLADAVVGDDDVATSVRALLAHTYRTRDAAAQSSAVPRSRLTAALAAYPHLTLVTGDGDVVSSRSALGGGTRGPSSLHLQAALDETRREHEEATRRRDECTQQTSTQQGALKEAKRRRDEALATLRAADTKLAQLTSKVSEVGAQERSARKDMERQQGYVDALAADIARHQAAADEAAAALEAARAEPEPPAPDTDALSEATRAITVARARETECGLAVRTAEERLSSVKGRVESLKRSIARQEAAFAQAQQRQVRRAAQARQAQMIAEVAGEATVVARALADVAKLRADALEQQRAVAEAAVTTARAQAAELQREAATLQTQAHAGDVAAAGVLSRLESLTDTATSHHDMDPDEVVATYGPDQPVPAAPGVDADPQPYDRAQQRKRLGSAERALRQLGRVNPLAIEEFDALQERHTYLVDQLEDLDRARADLFDLVAQIDARVLEVFTAAWHDVEREFVGVFARLFPGGEGKLVLTDPSDMLTTGIEVHARPAGKKVKRLSLLSGGERSLTAVALLVAIFKARPSPFYVLDEVEAALDDANLGRLLRLFEELRDTSQLLVITHQKRTMEVADALYGVTMKGDGVSRVVSQRMRDRVVDVRGGDHPTGTVSDDLDAESRDGSGDLSKQLP